MRRCFLGCLFAIFTLSANADVSTQPMTIKVIETGWSAEAIYVSTNEGYELESCGSARLRLDEASNMFEQDFALLMSAFHTQTKVVFRVSGCSGDDINIIAVALVN